MARELKDSVVVVTGASSGIGRATALAMAHAGAKVVLAARRREPLEAAARACEAAGGEALAVPTDMAEFDQVEALARQALERFGRIDTWVNNAGVLLVGAFSDIPIKDFRRVVDVDLMGYVHGAKVAIPHFQSRGDGVLINVGSIVSTNAQPLSTPYVTAKWAVRGFGNALRMDLRDDPRVKVCTLMPGVIDTPLFQHAANFSGRAVQAPPPVFPPEQVADSILALARRPRAEASVGAPGKLSTLMHDLAPATSERTMARAMLPGLFSDHAAGDTHGNLFRPMPYGTEASGGWRERPSGNGNIRHILWSGLAALAVPAALYYARRRAQRLH